MQPPLLSEQQRVELLFKLSLDRLVLFVAYLLFCEEQEIRIGFPLAVSA